MDISYVTTIFWQKIKMRDVFQLENEGNQKNLSDAFDPLSGKKLWPM